MAGNSTTEMDAIRESLPDKRENVEILEKYLATQSKLHERESQNAIDPETAKRYVRYIDDFFSHAEHDDLEQYAKKERQAPIARAVEDWLVESELAENWDPATKGLAAFAVASYYKTVYLYRIDHKILPFSANVRKASDDFDPDIFSYGDVETAFEYAPTTGEPRLVDGMVIGWNCLCRVKEIVQIQRDDVDLGERSVTIHGIKGSNDYTFTPDDPLVNDETPTPYGLWTALQNRIEDADSRGSDYLFASGNGHLNGSTMSTWFRRKIGKWGPFGETKSIHAFCRHTRVTQLLSDGHPIDEVQTWTRHKYRQTTQKYDHRWLMDRMGEDRTFTPVEE